MEGKFNLEDFLEQFQQIKKLGPLNKDFHLRIYQSAPYPYLFKQIVDLWEKFELMQSVFAYVPQRAIPSWDEHKKIVGALKAKNAALAARLVRQQKNRTQKALKKNFSKKNTLGSFASHQR